MSKHIEHGFIPQNISHISKVSNNPQDFVEEIRELNNHIQGKNIISEVMKKKQNSLFHSDSRNFQLINNQSIKQQLNQQSLQKNEEDQNYQQHLKKQEKILQEHQIQQKKLMKKISNIIQDGDKNYAYEQQKQYEYFKAIQSPPQNLNNYDQRQTQNQVKQKQRQFDPRFQYKRDQNSTDIETEGFNERQMKIMKHKQQSNIQYLMTQIKQVLTYNRHFLLQIQKLQTRRKIAQTQIQIRKLKIGMRNHAFTKTINYTSPIKKHNDMLIVKSPKKIDPQITQKYQYLLEKLQQIKLKSIQFDKKQQILSQYYQHLKSKNKNLQKAEFNQSSQMKINTSRSSFKLKSIYINKKSPIHKEYSKKSSLKTIDQTQKIRKQDEFKQDGYELGQKAVLILKKEALKDCLFDYEHFFRNKQQRLNNENHILKRQIYIINSQISNNQASQHIWKDRIQYQNQVKKIKNQKSQHKKRFEFIFSPKNSDFTSQLRRSKTPQKNNFNFTFKATDLCDVAQNITPLKNKVSLQQVTKKIKIGRQNLNSSRNSLSIRLKKNKSEKKIFQSQNNLVQNSSSKKGTIKTQESLDRNSINISAQNEYYNNQIL